MKDIAIGRIFHYPWTVRVLMLDVHMVCFPESGGAKQNDTHMCVVSTSRVTGGNPRDVRGSEGILSRDGFTFDVEKVVRLDVTARSPSAF